MKTTRAKEIIYFNAFSSQTLQDGVIHTFYAIDDFSTFAFILGTAKDMEQGTVLLHIKKLMKDKNFKSSPKKPFTLMHPFGNAMDNKILTIIKPHKGKVIFDADIVTAKTRPFIDSIHDFNS